MKIKNKKVKLLVVVILCVLLNRVNDVYAIESSDDVVELIEGLGHIQRGNQKIAYLTFDDGPSIYTEKILDVLNEHEVSGIFFILGSQLEAMPQSDDILNRMINEGHYIALHTMTHDKNALYWSEKSPATFTREMLELKNEVKSITNHVTNLCRAPYGKKGHFKAAHYQSVEEAGLYCVDWHVDSQDWAKKNAGQIYDEVLRGLEKYQDVADVVLLFHEYQRTVEALPMVIAYLKQEGYAFEPYVEGKIFKGLN